jgi:uncharacterized protein YaaR (DUF327 family)
MTSPVSQPNPNVTVFRAVGKNKLVSAITTIMEHHKSRNTAPILTTVLYAVTKEIDRTVPDVTLEYLSQESSQAVITEAIEAWIQSKAEVEEVDLDVKVCGG